MRILVSKLGLSIFFVLILVSSALGAKKLARAPNFTAPNLEGEKVELKTLLNVQQLRSI